MKKFRFYYQFYDRLIWNRKLLIELQHNSTMNQQGEKVFSMTKGYRWKPQEFLNSRVQKRGKTFFSSQKVENNNVDPFRKTEFRANTRFLKDLAISSSTPLKKEAESEERTTKQTHKSRKSAIRMQRSPYLTNSTYIQKMMRLLIPVQGPNESLKLSIKKHNDMNIRNAELLIVKRSQHLRDRMKAFSNRIGLPEDTRIFIMNSRDTHIKQALVRRGWVESGDKSSVLFHLKWVYKDELEDYQRLQEGQFFNHFKNNQELTNKNYLRKNIKKYSAQYRPNFPLSFDLEVNEDSSSFSQSYIKFEMFKILNKLGKHLQHRYPSAAEKVEKRVLFPRKLQKQQNRSHLLKNRQNYAQKQILYRTYVISLKKHTDLWQSIMNLFDFVCGAVAEIQKTTPVRYSIFYLKRQQKDMFAIIKKIEMDMEKQLRLNAICEHISQFYIIEILKLWHYSKMTVCQSYGFNNVWIVKPTGVSRGSGITITSDFMKINQLKYGKIVQKYIENPLLLDCKRKFDIRQWVLVKSFSPLKAYVFKKCYARLSSLKYSNQNYDNLQKHLTNYSQNKDIFIHQKPKINENFRSKVSTPTSFATALSEDDLSEQIPNWSLIKEQILKNIIKTLACCQIEVVSRDQCFEVFGFDIILDSHYKPYILEVNLSPACEKREFLEEYLQEMSDGLVDMFEGDEPTHWISLNLEQLEARAVTRQKIKEREENATKIQRWWRRNRSRPINIVEANFFFNEQE